MVGWNHSTRTRARSMSANIIGREMRRGLEPSASEEAATVATSATHDRGNVAAVADVAASGDVAIIRDNGEDGGFVL
jgi:hypothetical protein